ncbi:MAG TPA: type II secretion system protein [Gammaproteobacteria bacterium]|nr:type II secretion system protein [Gammaproteobacteria bacterium]
MSRLELAIAATIIGVLIGIVSYRANNLMAQAERVNVTQVKGRIRAALGLEVALRVARGRSASAAELAGSNPMVLLQTPPGNYLGVLRDADPARIDPGHWYFEASTRRLIYVVSHRGAFVSGSDGTPRAEFAIQLRYLDVDRNGRFDAGGDTLYGVDFAPATAFSWKNTNDD